MIFDCISFSIVWQGSHGSNTEEAESSLELENEEEAELAHLEGAEKIAEMTAGAGSATAGSCCFAPDCTHPLDLTARSLGRGNVTTMP